MKIEKILIVLCLILLIPSASALGMERVEFFEVEQGSTQSIIIDVYTAPSESENEFTYEIISNDQEVHDWITVSPETFTMPAGAQRQPITITLNVPVNAKLGDREGELKFAGSRVSGGGTIGYTVATKSVLHFKVVKEGAKKNIEFTSLDANSQIRPDEISKFETVIKNTGNVPTDFSVVLVIEENYDEIFKTSTAPMNLKVGLFEDVTLYWEPEVEGNYTGYFKIIFDDSVDEVEGTTLKSDTFMVIVTNEAKSLETDEKSLIAPIIENPLIAIGILCGMIGLVIVWLTLRSDKNNNKEEEDSATSSENDK